MSIAGARSTQGDEYQLCIALHWLIRLLEDDTIHGIQAESLGIPGEDVEVTVDDVVVLYKDGRACFIQVKKNQPQYRPWSFADKVLRDELCKARDQLEAKEGSEVKFYSQSPFSELQSLAKHCRIYPDFPNFLRTPYATQSKALVQFARIIERSEEQAHALACRLRFSDPLGFEWWDRQNRIDLDRIVPRADLAMPLLERLLGSHQAKLRDAKHVITRADLVVELEKHGLYPFPKRSETEILETFAKASKIGRVWLRTVDGERIPRVELSRLIELIKQSSRTILLTDRPGSGKTCLLLDLVDHIEQSTSSGLLFVKGDQFSEVKSELDLAAKGLPQDIVGQCARLAESRRVVVILDSLDVLSLSRRHGALQVFLSLVDRLEKIQGVTTVIACRDFDLHYDPLLRDRKWEHRITLGPLDFETVVVPFLHKWGVEPESLNSDLKQLLQLPQNLRLFEKLAKLRSTLRLISAHDLYERFLEEVVKNDPQLGDQVLIALQNMAERLMRARTQTFPRAALPVDESVLQRLISQEVLLEKSPSSLEFSHQTLADNLLVRSALANEKTLAAFILDHLPLPFIRPAVRTFFFHLRANHPDLFRRQLWTVLSHSEIAYHLKRLVSESLAEVTPVEEDWRLLNRFFREYPDLFRRLLWRTENDAWFDMLTRHWLPMAETEQDRESWLLQFANRQRVWMNRHSEKVVALWREAFSSKWNDPQRLGVEITLALDQFEAWETVGIRELLETLIENVGIARSSLGRSLSRWVQATNRGDDLLWRYIVRRVTSKEIKNRELEKELCCAPHHFHDENFLAERMCRSDELLSLALKDLDCWSRQSVAQYEEDGLRSVFLIAPSYRRRHYQRDKHLMDGLTVLLDGLETALTQRAKSDDTWWRGNEPHLQTSQEVTIRYFLLQAYKENIEANIAGIEAQLTDQALFRDGQLGYELGELMRAAYPFISEPTQRANQEMLLSLYADEKGEWKEHHERDPREIYEYLRWIPSFFRTQETQTFVELWRSRFDDISPQPHIKSPDGVGGCGFHTEQERTWQPRAVEKVRPTGWRLNAGQSRAIGELATKPDGGYPAMQMVIELPDELKGVGEAVTAMIRQVETSWRSTRGGRAVDYATLERQVAAGAAAIERASHQAVLQGLDIDQPRIVIEGQVYRRVGRYEADYYTLAGPVRIMRTLYRECGQRNAKTVNAVSLRCGVVGEGWLPATAQAMAYQLQQGTSREAENTAQILGRLPYARSSFESIGQEVGRQYTAVRVDLEESLIEEYTVPAEAASISVALDRVSVPMEEARTVTEREPQPGGRLRKVWRQFRMAYCATLTLHDRKGEAVHTIRYGRMPHGDVEELCRMLTHDVGTLLRKQPGLSVILLADGAADLWKLLTEHLNAETLGVPVRQLVDLWHLLEKLGSAARLLYGEPHGSTVLHGWRLRLLNRTSSVTEILQELHASGKEHLAVGTSRPIHEAITYLENHQARMNYAAARRRGLPVGSGNVEATCKSLVAVRMKRPGARWKEATGEHLLNLRALALSDRWESAMTLTLRPLRKAIRLAV